MNTPLLHAFDGAETDESRWLKLDAVGDRCVFYLAELCLPGRISRLRNFSVPRAALDDVLNGGSFQLALGEAYVYVSAEGDRVRLEFRHREDAGVTVAEVPRDGLAALAAG